MKDALLGGAAVIGQYAGVAGSRETREIEDVLGAAGELFERANGIGQMLDEMRGRLLGTSDPTGEDRQNVPTPVRAEIPELKHRLGQLRVAMIAIEQKVSALSRI